jgi:hypothetical protein
MTNCILPNEVISSVLNINNFTIDEIVNGISKRVYKIRTAHNYFILYIWLRPFNGELTENNTVGADYLWADGFEYFKENTKLLTDIGVRVPKILCANHFDDGDFDYAIVECFDGISLMQYMQNGCDVKDIADKITVVMNKLSEQKRVFYGPPLKTTPNDIPSVQLVYNFEAEELNIAAKLDNEVMEMKDKFLLLMKNLENKIDERKDQSYSLIHGELTPQHIWLLNDGTVGIIDIEAVKYFDIEYDWAVLELMYGGKIPMPESINTEKLEFYKVCLKVGYLSVAVDYIKNVNENNTFFRGLRDSNFKSLKEH